MRITIVTLLCLVLFVPAVALARSPVGGIQECRRLAHELAHYRSMTSRASQMGNPVWEKRFKDHVETLRDRQTEACPDVEAREQQQAMTDLLKLAAKAAAKYFTFGLY
jgi:hypothetical protein